MIKNSNDAVNRCLQPCSSINYRWLGCLRIQLYCCRKENLFMRHPRRRNLLLLKSITAVKEQEESSRFFPVSGYPKHTPEVCLGQRYPGKVFFHSLLPGGSSHTSCDANLGWKGGDSTAAEHLLLSSQPCGDGNSVKADALFNPKFGKSGWLGHDWEMPALQRKISTREAVHFPRANLPKQSGSNSQSSLSRQSTCNHFGLLSI